MSPVLGVNPLEDHIVLIQNVSNNRILCITLTKLRLAHPALPRLRKALVLRANSLIMTMVGDALAPRKQAVWLGSLIEMAALFELSSRLVRTSTFRLTADGWFEVQRMGRRSFYQLSAEGLARVQLADKRIYEFASPAWNGRWTLVVLDGQLRASQRMDLQRELKWQSFGQLSPTVFAHPQADRPSLDNLLRQTQTQHQVAVLEARNLGDAAALQAIMGQTYKLTQVAHMWAQFIQRFGRLNAAGLAPHEAFYVRTLLIHEYRRVLLRDPNLPTEFLPPHWPGTQGRALCKALYRDLLPGSEHHLIEHLQTSTGALKKTPRAIERRLR